MSAGRKMPSVLVLIIILFVLLSVITCSWNNPFKADLRIPALIIVPGDPDPVTGFGLYTGFLHLDLSWDNPTVADFAGVQIQRSFSGYPAAPTDGTTVYNSAGVMYRDDSDRTNDIHYYTAFAYDTENNFSTAALALGTPVGHKWFLNFTEYASNPVVFSVTERRYYPSVVYDVNAFGHTLGEDIDGGGGGADTYNVLPYYKMWVGDGSDTHFLYSDDGLNWVAPTVGVDIIAGHYHPTVMHNTGGVTYRMWNWLTSGTAMEYFTSTDGIAWTAVPAGNLTPADGTHGGADYLNPGAPIYGLTTWYENSTFYGMLNNNGNYYLVSTETPEVGTSWWNHGLTQLDGANFGSADGSLSVIHRNNIFECWYPSTDDGDFLPSGDRRHGISYCEATDIIDGTEDILSFATVNTIDYKGVNATHYGPKQNAILKITDGVAWRNEITYTPWIIYDADRFSGHGEARHYKMYFVGDPTVEVTHRRAIGYLSFDEPAPD